MRQLIRRLFLKRLGNPILNRLTDSARLPYPGPLAFTTDSFVVSPLFFPGGDIGKLAVCGTVNDLLMSGAVPEYLSLAFIIEEGLDYALLERVAVSLAAQAGKSRVRVVTGDLKVVEKGAADQLFINTAGVGRILPGVNIGAEKIRRGDKIIVSGEIGQHGIAVAAKRHSLGLNFNIKSDCAALDGLILPLLKKISALKFMRDPTRGGLAAALNEMAQSSGLGVFIRERDIPVSAAVRAACELLGLDPLHLACEGRVVLAVGSAAAKKALAILRRHPLGVKARVIGEAASFNKGRVVLETAAGTQRFVEMPSGDLLPRIC